MKLDFDDIAEAISPDQFAQAIGAMRNGKGYHCPNINGHSNGDRNPSLSISRVNGRTVAHCHGCDLRGYPVQVASTIWGMTPDAAAEKLAGSIGVSVPQERPAPKVQRKISATYSYVDEEGTLLFEAVKYEPKDFRQRRPDGNGGWTWSVKGVRRVLYRLPEVLEAVGLGKIIYIVEGEKDVHALEEVGGVGTCNPMGAGKWKPEYSESLRGALVRIVADKDVTGRSHARDVAQALQGVAASVEVMEAKEGNDTHDHVQAGYGLDDFQPMNLDESEGQDDDEVGAPVIVVRQELNAVTGEAIDALMKRPDLGIYVRGRMLVTVGRDGSTREGWLRRPPGSPVIVPIEQARMMALLDEAAEWLKFNAREKELNPARPPEWVAIQILSRLEWPFPYLDVVVETPTLRPDGSNLDTPGWDEATGILYDPLPGLHWTSVPDHPTKKDIEDAVSDLLDPVADFPFVAESDRSAYLAAGLTLLGRHMIDGPVPMFPIRAPTPATGKGLLAQVIGIIGTGRVPPAMTMSHQEEELRKRITALAVGGSPLVLLDNLSGSVGSDALAAALTTTEWEDRILGSTQMVRVPLRTVWIATGNNLGFKRTLGRRVVPIDLDAKVETPEDRPTSRFRYPNLLSHVQEVRPRLVVAGLTILRAFHLSGRPRHGEPRMGSFEAWDDLVRSALVWAGQEDPASTEEGKARGRIRGQADDDLENLSALLQTLRNLYGTTPFSTAAIITKAKDDSELQAVLDTVATPRTGGHTTAHSLGAQFRNNQDRPVGGLILRRLGRVWTVETEAG